MKVDALIVDTDTGEARSGEVGCDRCGMLACVCNIQSRHAKKCKFRVSATCAIPIECEHGYDVCPKCDPCTCGAGVARADFAPSAGGKEGGGG